MRIIKLYKTSKGFFFTKQAANKNIVHGEDTDHPYVTIPWKN